MSKACSQGGKRAINMQRFTGNAMQHPPAARHTASKSAPLAENRAVISSSLSSCPLSRTCKSRSSTCTEQSFNTPETLCAKRLRSAELIVLDLDCKQTWRHNACLSGGGRPIAAPEQTICTQLNLPLSLTLFHPGQGNAALSIPWRAAHLSVFPPLLCLQFLLNKVVRKAILSRITCLFDLCLQTRRHVLMVEDLLFQDARH